MGEGTKYATVGGNPAGKFIEQINYQEIDEGEVRILNFNGNYCLFSKFSQAQPPSTARAGSYGQQPPPILEQPQQNKP